MFRRLKNYLFKKWLAECDNVIVFISGAPLGRKIPVKKMHISLSKTTPKYEQYIIRNFEVRGTDVDHLRKKL